MEIKSETHHVYCLAMSPDNERIFSGGEDKKLLIYDAQMYSYLLLIFLFYNNVNNEL